MTSSIISKASVSLRVEQSFGEGTKPCRVLGDALEFSRAFSSLILAAKPQKVAKTLTRKKRRPRSNCKKHYNRTNWTAVQHRTSEGKTAHQNSEDGNAPIAPQSDYIVKRTISTFLLI